MDAQRVPTWQVSFDVSKHASTFLCFLMDTEAALHSLG